MTRHLLRIGPASEYIGRHESYLRRLVAARRIRFYRVGRRVLFDVADLDALLDAAAVEEGGR